MNNKFFLAIFLCFQMLITSTSIYAMEERGATASASQDPRLSRLSSALNGIFGVDIQIKDDVVTLRGSQSQLDQALARLGDFNQLRQIVVPFDQKAVLTQACPKPSFTCWQDCMTALGIQPNDLSNFAIQFDQNNRLQIPYDSTFNKKTADAYVEALKKESRYFDWISRRNPELFQYIDNSIIINYGLLTEHFCSLKIEQELTESTDIFASTLSLQSVLKKLSAAAGSDLSLVRTGNRGEYHVRTVMQGHSGQLQGQGSHPTIEIVIDKSGSMEGERINTINDTMPTLLSQFREALKAGESLRVDVYAFHHEIALHQTYMLIHADQSVIRWNNIITSGGTDLTLVGERLRLTRPDERKVVVAFTDGKHEVASKNIGESLKSLEALQREGTFAQPYFCRVGAESTESALFFNPLSRTFAGSFKEHDSIQQFCTTVASNIPSLLESNEPLVLTIGGTHITIRQPDAQPDIHTTSQVLRKGDSVMYRTNRLTVYDTPPLASASAATSASATARASQTRKEKLEAARKQFEAAQAELARLEELEEKSEEK